MKVWSVQDAKARFSEFLEACLCDGPQMVTKRGAEAAVLIPAAQWRRLHAAAMPSLKELLQSDAARTESWRSESTRIESARSESRRTESARAWAAAIRAALVSAEGFGTAPVRGARVPRPHAATIRASAHNERATIRVRLTARAAKRTWSFGRRQRPAHGCASTQGRR